MGPFALIVGPAASVTAGLSRIRSADARFADHVVRALSTGQPFVAEALVPPETVSAPTFGQDPTGRWHVGFLGLRFGASETARPDCIDIAAAVARLGIDAAQLGLNGDWNLIAWDEVEQVLIISRDRFGTRELFHVDLPGGAVAVADSLRTLIALGIDEPDVAALHFSSYLLRTTTRTAIRGVASVPPGCSVRFFPGSQHRTSRWWRTVDHVETMSDHGSDSDALRELLLDAVAIRIPESGPVATSLSGGLDSSAVAALVDAVLRDRGDDRERQRLHHQGFAGSPQDETGWARQVAQHLGLEFIDTSVRIEDVTRLLPDSIRDFEGDHYLPVALWSHFRAVGQASSVSFEGLAADSLYAGSSKIPVGLRRDALRRGRLLRWSSFVSDDRASVFAEDLRSVFGPEALRNALRPALRAVRARRGLSEGIAEVESLIAERRREVELESRELAPINRALYLSTHMTSLPTEIRNFWRVATAHRVTLLNPFLDWRVVTSAFAMTESAKIGDGWSKRILRDVAAPFLPSEVVWRRDKMGFTAPMLEWTAAALRSVMVDAAGGASSRWITEGLAARIIRAEAADDVRELRRLWPLVQRELWIGGLVE